MQFWICIAAPIIQLLGEKKNGLTTASYISGYILFFLVYFSLFPQAKHAQ